MKNWILTLLRKLSGSSVLDRKIEANMRLNAQILTNQHINSDSITSINQVEYKVFSEWGDDGIIQYLINKIQISNQFFVEFGVENYQESNTRFLLTQNNWRGLIMDGSPAHIAEIQRANYYFRHDLTAVNAFITAENIDQLIQTAGVPLKVGLLSIDIDGNDYWVWKSIQKVDADIVIVEYNALFGSELAITIPYHPNFLRMKAHYSGLYWGASLSALCYLANEKGYSFIGCNSNANNAYFIKNELLIFIPNIKPVTPQGGYRESRFRQSRSKTGKLTFLSNQEAKKIINKLPVIDVVTNRQLPLELL